MPLMQQAVLEDHLRTEARFGNTIRIRLCPALYKYLVGIKAESERTYHDIVRIIVNVYRHRPGFFDNCQPRRLTRTIHVRLSRQEAGWLLDKAWSRGLPRGVFLGMIIDKFVNAVPRKKLLSVLVNQEDRALRLIGG